MNKIFAEYNPFWFGIDVRLDILDEFEVPTKAFWLFLESSSTGPGPKHLEYIHAQSTEELKYLAINLFSLFSHEHRHWIDMISTPFGIYVQAQTFSFHVNSLSCFETFVAPATIYAPLDKNSNDEFEGILPAVRKNYVLIDKIEDWMAKTIEIGGKGISAIHILESLAILQQQEYIAHFFDLDCLDIFKQNSRKLEVYGFLLDFLTTSLHFNEKAAFRLLYFSLFGCKGTIGNDKLDVSPPALLALFLAKTSPEDDIDKRCAEILIDYQGFPPFASLFLSRQKINQHISIVEEQLRSAKVLTVEFQILLSSLQSISDIGNDIFELVQSDSEIKFQHLLIGYAKITWPLIYYQTLGLHLSDNFPDLNEVVKIYYSYIFDNSNRDEIFANTPIELKSVVDTLLSQIPEDYDGKFTVLNFFSLISKGDETPGTKDIDRIPQYFKVMDIFEKLLYFDVLFRGKKSLEYYNQSEFERRHFFNYGQKILFE